jgi:amidase
MGRSAAGRPGLPRLSGPHHSLAARYVPRAAGHQRHAAKRIDRVNTFITRLDHPGRGPRLAVKDLIDVRGAPTTAGSKAVAETARPAQADAPCLAGARAADAAIVGKANLYELAYGACGTNDWYGTPVNPLDPALLPGGSSSGSAVAVAEGSADYGYGTDTGGSVRIPAAFCGLAGLKTTYGRISTDGVWPLSPSLDTVGPIAHDVAGLAAAMALLEPGFMPNWPVRRDGLHPELHPGTGASRPLIRLGRLRPAADGADPRVDAAIDAVLERTGVKVTEVELPEWPQALMQTHILLSAEATRVNAALLADPATRDKLGAEVRAKLEQGAAITPGEVGQARAYQTSWQAEWTALLSSVDAVVLPTVAFFPPPLTEASLHHFTQLTAPVNLAGLPALALPVPAEHSLPASLQLVGPAGGEETLLAIGALVEDAAGYRR